MENFINIPDISFAYLAASILHYGLFGKLVEGLSPLSIFDIPENLNVGIHYRRYSELVAGPHPTFNCNCYKKDAHNTDENNNGGVVEDGVVAEKVVNNRAADDNDDQGKGNN